MTMKCEIPEAIMQRVKACEAMLMMDGKELGIPEYEFTWQQEEVEDEIYYSGKFNFDYRGLNIEMIIAEMVGRKLKVFFEASHNANKWIVLGEKPEQMDHLLWDAENSDLCINLEEATPNGEYFVNVTYSLPDMQPNLLAPAQYAGLVKAALEMFLLNAEVFDIDYYEESDEGCEDDYIEDELF